MVGSVEVSQGSVTTLTTGWPRSYSSLVADALSLLDETHAHARRIYSHTSCVQPLMLNGVIVRLDAATLLGY